MAKGRNTNTQTVLEQSLGLDPGTALSSAFDVGTEPSNFNPVGTYAASNTIDKTYSNVGLDKLNEEQKNSTWFTQNDSQNQQIINERLGQDQSVGDTWLKGIAKFVGKTGTAVVGGTLGILYGVPASIGSGELNKLYDNDFTKALDKADEWMDDKMKVYQTKEQEEQSWYKQMVPFSGSASKFWADDVLGGLSFTVGAVLSETAWAGATAATFGGAEVGLAANTARLTAKATNLMKKIGQAENVASAGRFTRQLLTGAGYESGVEARHTKNEILSSMKKEYKDTFGTDVDERSSQYAEMLDKANDAANSVWAANMALLSAGNAITLPKTFGQLSKGISTKAGDLVESEFVQNNRILKGASDFGKDVRRGISEFGEKVESKLPKWMQDKLAYESADIMQSSRASVSELKRVAKATGRTVEEVKQSQFINKWDTYNRLQKGIRQTGTFLKQPITEGFIEEGGQGAISEAAKIYVAKKYDPNGIDQAVSLYDSMGEAFAKTYGSEKGWKEIGIGMIIGSAGLPHIGRKTNEDGTTSRDFSWQGGIMGELAQATAERAETADIVDMMNKNNALVSTKALWQAQIREGANEIDKQIVDGKFVEKNKDAESFFNYVHSRIKGGYFANIKDETAKQVKEMKLNEFADAFGYTNMTESELKKRQEEVVEKVVKRAGQIKDAVDLAEKIDKFGIDDVKEGLAYSISMLNNIDERQENMTKDMNKALGFDFSKDDYKAIKALNSEKSSKFRELKKVQKELDKAFVAGEDTTQLNAKLANVRKEFKNLEKSIPDLKDKETLGAELNTYSGDIEQVHNHLRNNAKVKARMEELRQTNPDKVEEINETFNDLESLDYRRKAFIESYNNLRTKEGQQAFTDDINKFKSYLFADIPERLSKQSATLAYYKQLGEQLRGEVEKASTPPTTASISGSNVPPAAPVTFAPVVNTPPATSTNAGTQLSSVFAPQTEPSPIDNPVASAPVSNVPLTPQQEAQIAFDEDAKLIAAMFTNPGEDPMEVEGLKPMTMEQRSAFMFKLQPIVLRSYKNYKVIKPDATIKDVAKAIIDSVSKAAQLTEPQFKTLITMVNSVLGDDQTQWYSTTFDQQYNIPQQAVTIELAGLVPSPSANNEVKPAEYGHDKNANSANSLAYLSHEYKEGQGKLETTKLAENENKQALLASNEVFNSPVSIKAQAIVGTEPVNRLLLNNDVQIILEDNGKIVKTSMHDPRWIIEIADEKGNSIFDDTFIASMVADALTGRPSLIISSLEREYKKITKETLQTDKFRNTYGESIEEVVSQFVKLVKMKSAILNHPNKDQPFEVNITDISPGKISFLKGYENSTDTLLQKDLKFGVVGMNGTIMATNTEPHSLNEKSLISTDYWQDKQGTVVVFVPVKGSRFVPVALRNKKVEKFSNESKLMLGAVYEFLNPTPLKTSINGQGLQLNKADKVKKFLSIYSTFIHNLSKTDMGKQFNKILIDFSDANEDGSKPKAIQIVIPQYVSDVKSGNGAPSLFIRKVEDIDKTLGQLAKEQGLTVKEGVANNVIINENTPMREIILGHNIGKSVSIETSIFEKSLVEGSAKVPTFVFNEDSNRIEQGEEIAYADHIKSRTLSNVNGKIEDPSNKDKYMHVEQPVFTFDVDLSKKEVIKSTIATVFENLASGIDAGANEMIDKIVNNIITKKETKEKALHGLPKVIIDEVNKRLLIKDSKTPIQEEENIFTTSGLFRPVTLEEVSAEVAQPTVNAISFSASSAQDDLDFGDEILVADNYSETKKNEVESQNTQCE